MCNFSRDIRAGGRLLATYTYTDDGNNYLSRLDYGNADSVNYTYDDKGRLTLETFEDGDTVAYTYNNDGALATVTDSATGITTTHYYDFVNRLAKYTETGGRSHSVEYTYDSDNNLSRLKEIINGTAYTTDYAYDDDNRVTSVTSGSASEHYTYDGIGRVDQTVTKQGDTTVLTESYTFKSPTGETSLQLPPPRLPQTVCRRQCLHSRIVCCPVGKMLKSK